ncbi:hypothetical protein HDU93_003970 [Gonapodya sp. JEL0774]|nr:hypothetical protein HDU93_003970 [Gonapodya sp. JEL0774]
MEHYLSQATELKGGLRVFQTLPRHLRRRAASWNTKKLPKKVRERAEMEALKDPKSLQKTFSRTVSTSASVKHSRGISVTEDFARRANRPGQIWLETHVWHAKRMHMGVVGGFKVSLHPNDKSTRATHSHALHQFHIHDASYTRTVYVHGPASSVAQVVEGVTDPGAPSVGGKRFTGGIRQGRVVVYSTGGWPRDVLGPASFVWDIGDGGEQPQPTSSDTTISDRPRRLWLFLPPLLLAPVLASLAASVAQLADPSSVTVGELSHPMLRFELTGPRTIAALKHVLKVVDPRDPLVGGTGGGEGTVTGAVQVNKASHEAWKVLQECRTAASWPAGCVVGMHVWDPRLACVARYTPLFRTSVGSDRTLHKLLLDWPKDLARSPLWDEEVRKALSANVPTEKSLNERRSQNLIPGTPLSPCLSDPPIPILLMHRGTLSPVTAAVPAARESREIESGLDLLVPQGWGMAFWKALAFAGGVVGGHRDRRFLHFEALLPSFPYDHPSTSAYAEHAKEVTSHAAELHGRKPPAKRVNYAKNGVRSPFGAEWRRLFWDTDADTQGDGSAGVGSEKPPGYWVVESPALVKTLQELLESSTPLSAESACSALTTQMIATAAKRGVRVPIDDVKVFANALVRVRLEVVGKGKPEENFFVRAVSEMEYRDVEKEAEAYGGGWRSGLDAGKRKRRRGEDDIELVGMDDSADETESEEDTDDEEMTEEDDEVEESEDEENGGPGGGTEDMDLDVQKPRSASASGKSTRLLVRFPALPKPTHCILEFTRVVTGERPLA